MMFSPNWGFCYGDTSSHHRRRKANFWPFCDIVRSRPTAWYQWSVGRTPITGKGETLFMSPSPTLGCTYIADRMYGHWIHGKIGYCGQSSIWDIYNESAFDGLNSDQISGLHCARYIQPPNIPLRPSQVPTLVRYFPPLSLSPKGGDFERDCFTFPSIGLLPCYHCPLVHYCLESFVSPPSAILSKLPRAAEFSLLSDSLLSVQQRRRHSET